MKPVYLKTKTDFTKIGDDSPIIVNCNVGANDSHSLRYEREKIDALFSIIETTPDSIMDLSIFDKQGILLQYIIDNYNVPTGVVPIYAFKETESLDTQSLLYQIEHYAKLGVSFMTLHFTADLDLYQKAKLCRKIPCTSRGGAIILKDAYKRKGCNIYRECLDEIVKLAKKYNFVISLGTTFRPAGIEEACDEIHLLETERQITLCHYLQDKGVSVMLENVGHISLDKIAKHSNLLRKANAPIMPLGPIVIDSAVGYDNIAASIGGAFMGFYGVAHIINAISSVEHISSFFSIKNAKEAVVSAKIAATSVNVFRFPEIMKKETYIYEKRAARHSCIASGTEECKRCNVLCPLKTKIDD